MTSIDPNGGRRRSLLVTGCFRSGTTLLEKLLHNHPQACVASQPFPHLYYLVKQRFLDECGCRQRYPLDHQFRQAAYSRRQWLEFLGTHRLSAGDLEVVFDRLRDAPGAVWTPEVHELRGGISAGTFHEVRDQLVDQLARRLGCGGAALAGTKEVMCEEFVPAMLDRGTRVALVVRDPRAVIASLDFQDRGRPMGEHRPLLFSLRVWRKSAAYALALDDQPSFCLVRYEDLVSRSAEQLERLTRRFQLEAFGADAFCDGIRDQQGQWWSGNSSFVEHDGVGESSKDAFASRLPAEVLAYIETVCGPEMAALGYAAGRGAADRGRLDAFREPLAVTHRLFAPDYSFSARRVDEERQRLRMLDGTAPEPGEAEQVEWFLFRRAYERLRDAVRERTGS